MNDVPTRPDDGAVATTTATKTRTVPTNLVVELTQQLEMRADKPAAIAELDRVRAAIAETESKLDDLYLQDCLLRLELLPRGVDKRLMDLARAIYFDTLDGPDRNVPIGELARRLSRPGRSGAR